MSLTPACRMPNDTCTVLNRTEHFWWCSDAGLMGPESEWRCFNSHCHILQNVPVVLQCFCQAERGYFLSETGRDNPCQNWRWIETNSHGLEDSVDLMVTSTFLFLMWGLLLQAQYLAGGSQVVLVRQLNNLCWLLWDVAVAWCSVQAHAKVG